MQSESMRVDKRKSSTSLNGGAKKVKSTHEVETGKKSLDRIEGGRKKSIKAKFIEVDPKSKNFGIPTEDLEKLKPPEEKKMKNDLMIVVPEDPFGVTEMEMIEPKYDEVDEDESSTDSETEVLSLSDSESEEEVVEGTKEISPPQPPQKPKNQTIRIQPKALNNVTKDSDVWIDDGETVDINGKRYKVIKKNVQDGDNTKQCHRYLPVESPSAQPSNALPFKPRVLQQNTKKSRPQTIINTSNEVIHKGRPIGRVIPGNQEEKIKEVLNSFIANDSEWKLVRQSSGDNVFRLQKSVTKPQQPTKMLPQTMLKKMQSGSTSVPSIDLPQETSSNPQNLELLSHSKVPQISASKVPAKLQKMPQNPPSNPRVSKQILRPKVPLKKLPTPAQKLPSNPRSKPIPPPPNSNPWDEINPRHIRAALEENAKRLAAPTTSISITPHVPGEQQIVTVRETTFNPPPLSTVKGRIVTSFNGKVLPPGTRLRLSNKGKTFVPLRPNMPSTNPQNSKEVYCYVLRQNGEMMKVPQSTIIRREQPQDESVESDDFDFELNRSNLRIGYIREGVEEIEIMKSLDGCELLENEGERCEIKQEEGIDIDADGNVKTVEAPKVDETKVKDEPEEQPNLIEIESPSEAPQIEIKNEVEDTEEVTITPYEITESHHSIEVPENRPITQKCSYCTAEFPYKSSLFLHEVLHRKNGDEKLPIYACRRCKFFTYEKDEMSQHYMKHL